MSERTKRKVYHVRVYYGRGSMALADTSGPFSTRERAEEFAISIGPNVPVTGRVAIEVEEIDEEDA